MGDVWGLYGDAGSGKTTLCAKILKSLPHCAIYSRMKFNLPNYHLLTPLTLIELEKTEKEVIVVWDEGYEELDNRDFMTLKSKVNSYILFQRRKRNLNFLGIAPLYMFDVRWRKLEKIAFFAKDRPLTNPDGKPCTRDFKYTVIQWRQGKIKHLTFPYKTAKKYFQYFDTSAIIQPHDIEEIKLELSTQNPEQLDKLIDVYVNKLWKTGKIPNTVKEISVNFVKNLMLRERLNPKLASYVCIRLKEKTLHRGEQQ